MLSGCALPAVPACPPGAGAPSEARPGIWPKIGPAIVYVLDQGWHTEIGVPASGLTGRLAPFRRIFPGVKTLMIGFGKRTFITARVETWRELVLGPVPGPGALEVTGLNTTPQAAYPDDTVYVLALPPGGEARLADYLSARFATDPAGRPRLIGPGLNPGSLFYASRQGYSLAYTCNSWTTQALRAAGLLQGETGNTVLAHQTMRAAAASGAACASP